MVIYMVGKPKNREELEAIAMYDQIIFIDAVEEYLEHRLYGKLPSPGVDNELRDHPQRPVHHRTQPR